MSLRRHIPPVLFLLAMTALLLAAARPVAVVTLPSNQQTIILAMDVSGSMRATDVNPSRIMAAETAAKAYIKDQPRDVRIGIVAFAATALLVQAPTTDHPALNAAIDRFELQRGTAVGSGILVSLKTIFPDVEFDLRGSNPRDDPRGVPLDKAGASGKAAPKTVPPGSYTLWVIVKDVTGLAGKEPPAHRIARRSLDFRVTSHGSTHGSRKSSYALPRRNARRAVVRCCLRASPCLCRLRVETRALSVGMEVATSAARSVRSASM